MSFHSVAVVLTLVQTKQVRINIHKQNNTKTQYKQNIRINIHKQNNTKTQYKQYKNTVQTIQNTVQPKLIRINIHKRNNTKTQYKQYKTQYNQNI